MKTGLRRCLYIGLGGTGMTSLLHTKKMFLENYGEIPPMIGFLGIDTDGGVYTKSIDSTEGKVSLNASEQASIISKEAPEIFEVNREECFSWMPNENVAAIESMTIGAGQVRSNGRLAISINYEKVKKSIKDAITRITNANIIDNQKYKLLSNTIEVHMVFSICGGTGAGTFIDAAYLIRNILPNDGKLVGYGVLPEVFEIMAPGVAMARVKPNAYGSLKDLDYLMHLDANSRPVELKYFGHTETVNRRPFNAIMLVDNKNKNNDTFTHVNQLAEMISLSLVTSAGELSVAAASVSDNIDKYIADGSMGVKDKRAWIAGVGACEILFKGKQLAEIYSLKATQRLIQLLLSGCNDITSVVNQWIDEIKIRENNGRDDIIDFLLNKNPRYPLADISDEINPNVEIEQYLSAAKADLDKVEARRVEKLQETQETLDELLKKQLNQDCGIDNFENIILGVQQQIELFIGEMVEEEEDLMTRTPQIEITIKTLTAELTEIASKTFILNKKNKLDQKKEEITSAVYNLAINRREIVRRQQAIIFYNSVKGIIEDKHQQIQTIKNQVQSIYTDINNNLNRIQNQVGSNTQSFQIDLAPALSTRIKVNNEDLSIDEFVKSLATDDGIFNFNRLKKEEVTKKLLQYTYSLPRAKRERARTIDEVINSLDESEFNHLIDMANSKSLPLLQKSYKGHRPSTSLYEGFYIGVPNKNSRFIKDDALKNKIGATSIEFIPTGMNDRVIFYRQEGVIPTFALDPLSGYKAKYEDCNINCHFDNNLLTRMNREDFGFYPKQEKDKSINIWVWGLIFGLIKFENDSFHYINKKEGQPLTNYWIDLQTSYRDEAFSIFKSNIRDIIKDYEEYVNQIETEKGSSEMEKFKNDVKKNYFEKYSQSNLTMENLLKRENGTIASLMNEEIKFVNDEL